MIKTKMLHDGIMSCDDRLDYKINKFIEEMDIKVVDIKFAPIGRDNRPTALIIYEVEDDENAN